MKRDMLSDSLTMENIFLPNGELRFTGHKQNVTASFRSNSCADRTSEIA